jgi:hypothetical protein
LKDVAEHGIPQEETGFEHLGSENMLKKEEYLEAVAGEGWAINDYKDMVSKSDDPKEKKLLEHIMKEEEEHLMELQAMMARKGYEWKTVHAPGSDKLAGVGSFVAVGLLVWFLCNMNK